ncbi:MAG: heme ABC transporter permease CcmB, partial [Chloroflexi bacterium]
MNNSLLWRATKAVFVREVRSELRSRQALNAVALFAVCSIVAVSIGLGPLNRSAELPLIHAALLWIVLLFAAFTALARVFVVEEEQRTAAALRLAAPAHAVYLGKLLFNLVLLRMQVKAPSAFAVMLAAGSLGLVTGTTLIAAIIARASSRSTLFAVLSFPLLIPLLVTAVRGTALAL